MLNATTCMHQHLEQISDHVHRLFHASCQAQGERDITAELTRIWDVTCELRRALATPAIVEGYRLDALDQVRRVGELIAEMGADPDHHQLLALGLAAELAVEKLWALKGITAAAKDAETATKVDHGMDRLAA